MLCATEEDPAAGESWRRQTFFTGRIHSEHFQSSVRTHDGHVSSIVGNVNLPGTGSDRVSPFVSFSLGVTVFNPAGLGSEDKFSFSLGGGVKYFLGERVGLRLQLRWTPTYVNSTSEGVFCNPFGFCYVVQDAHYVNQTEASAGLIIKF